MCKDEHIPANEPWAGDRSDGRVDLCSGGKADSSSAKDRSDGRVDLCCEGEADSSSAEDRSDGREDLGSGGKADCCSASPWRPSLRPAARPTSHFCFGCVGKKK